MTVWYTEYNRMSLVYVSIWNIIERWVKAAMFLLLLPIPSFLLALVWESVNTWPDKTQSFPGGWGDKITCMHLSVGIFDFYLPFELKIYVKRNAVKVGLWLKYWTRLRLQSFTLWVQGQFCVRNLFLWPRTKFSFFHESTNFYARKPLR